MWEEYPKNRAVKQLNRTQDLDRLQARERTGLTQAEVAAKAHTTQPLIARIEAGSGWLPTFRLLDRIARALGLRVTLALEADRAT